MLARVRLSVVIPAYNEAASAAETIRSATAAISRSAHFASPPRSWSPTTARRTERATLRSLRQHGVPVRIERLPENSGRFVARRAGLEAAAGDYVLFLDAGVTVNRDGLRFVGDALEAQGADVWNAHTLMITTGNPLGLFWGVVSALAFPDYIARPRTTSFDAPTFDRFPKVTTCFFAPRAAPLGSCRNVSLALLRFTECKRRHAAAPPSRR